MTLKLSRPAALLLALLMVLLLFSNWRYPTPAQSPLLLRGAPPLSEQETGRPG